MLIQIKHLVVFFLLQSITLLDLSNYVDFLCLLKLFHGAVVNWWNEGFVTLIVNLWTHELNLLLNLPLVLVLSFWFIIRFSLLYRIGVRFIAFKPILAMLLDESVNWKIHLLLFLVLVYDKLAIAFSIFELGQYMAELVNSIMSDILFITNSLIVDIHVFNHIKPLFLLTLVGIFIGPFFIVQ